MYNKHPSCIHNFIILPQVNIGVRHVCYFCVSFWTHNMTKNMRALFKLQLITVLHVHVCQFQDAYEIDSLQVKHNSQLLLPDMFLV